MFRYYAPECGRFVRQALIGLKGGWSRYHYPLNPITDSDLLGLITCGTDRDDPGKLLR
ncbi:TPA: RHS repeat-associated core domain-containing protein [Salmonella enterica]